MKEPAKYKTGDVVRFLGSQKSCYGTNSDSDRFIGEYVTIENIHPTGYPYAYTFNEISDLIRAVYWFSESCFEEASCPDLPDFEPEKSLDQLFL